jgi:hypothetical protein
MPKVASWFAYWSGLMIVGNAFSMDKFLAIYQGKTSTINKYIDSNGQTALHALVKRQNATIEEVRTLLSQGADPEIRTYLFKDSAGVTRKGDDVYKNGIKYQGQSPAGLSEESPLGKNQYIGDKNVMNYIFCEMLSKKLEKIAVQQK